MKEKVFAVWNSVQEFLDIKGDVVMLFFTGAVIWQVLHGHDIGASNAAAYASAIGLFGYAKVAKLSA